METLTVHYLARELDARWRGRRVTSFVMSATPLGLAIGASGAATVRFDLSRPDCRVHFTPEINERGPLDGYEIAAVGAPVDDRRMIISLVKPGKFRGSAARHAQLVISFVPNARGAQLSGQDGHRFGAIGRVPEPKGDARPLLDAHALRAAAATGDPHALMGGRWIGPAVADWLLANPETIVEAYAAIAALPDPKPSQCAGRILPLPLCSDPEAVDSVIEAESADGLVVRDRAKGGNRHERAIERMRAELERAGEAPVFRAAADALTALPAGVTVPSSLTLPDGRAFAIDARPGESAHDVAERLFARARAMDRARASLPARIAELETRAPVASDAARGSGRASAEIQPRQPYRRYTSRGGLEIRVGRSARDNDALTFHGSSPDDVWMHARGAAGSHVVLRWTRDESPPAADLEEAAMLAAWHSRARGSAVVPVDWTRRKYVRKPRGAAHGSVVVSRARTIMVRPTDAAVRSIRDRG